jgi:hypothetical protein
MSADDIEVPELDPTTLRAMARQMNDVADMALSGQPDAERRAVAGFASGTAARYRSTAIEIEQARAQRRAAAERAMRAPTAELPIFVPLAERPRALQGEPDMIVERVPRSWVTGRRQP